MTARRLAALPCGILLLAAAAARASWLEPLFMPGPVAEKHASLEKECTKCHQPFDKQAQSGLCLACHDEVAADLAAPRGYHGRHPGLSARACQSCHSEHRGRAAALAPLERDTFDHTETDRPLRGAHNGLACEGCHPPGSRFRDAPADCGTCHAATDPHANSLGGQCDLCHEENAWSAVRFDHDRARFPLVGKHRQAACTGCHATRRFRPTSDECRSCHAGDDRHRGAFGADCRACHDPRGWKNSFDHARRTRFPLLGKHASAACEDCHRPHSQAPATPTECRACHADDEPHRGRFGARCDGCHSPLAWRRTSFDHGRDTKFALVGHHREVDCLACHRAPVAKNPPSRDCVSCHRDRDVHRGREGTRCQSCHDERGWSRGVLFDHAATRFPLGGAHLRVACTRCHSKVNVKDVRRDCLACHERDDVHRGERGALCERCHDDGSWRSIRAPRD